MSKFHTFLFFALISLGATWAQTDDPRHPLFQKTQPDGTPLLVRMYGGSHADFVFYTTTDSIALVLDNDGAYCYAKPSGGHLVSTGVLAHEPGNRSEAEEAVAASTPHLFDALESIKARAQRRRIAPQQNNLTAVSSDGIGIYGRTLGGKVNSIGEYTIPVVLVQFADRSFNANSTNEKYLRWLNGENYTEDGAAGSVRQYFVDQSKGLFTPNFEIAARITLDSSYVYYGKDEGDAHDVNLISKFLPAVMNKLKDKGVNLARFYDSRTDNCIPLLAFLYAGTGQAQSGMANDIWPCELDLGADYSSYTGGYRVNSIFFGNEWANGKMNGLGTFTHEFGHALGLPDIYATKYGHSTPLTGYWSIMESGCYLEGGFRPIDYLAHEKSQLGWLKLTEPTEPHVYTLYPMSDDREPHALLLRNPENEAEYYILENRQPGRWSPEDFGKGLLVTHIDYNATNWAQNNVNNDGTHPRTVVVPGDNHLTNDASDLYPSGTNRVLHDRSQPATKVYTGSGLKHPVYAIKALADGTVTLSYGSASAPQYFVGDTVYVTASKLTCLVSALKELTVIAADGGYTGDITIPSDSIYFDHARYKYVAVSDNAFAGCEGLTSVHIGNKVRSVGAGAFRNSSALSAITVSEDNAYYKAVDGVLYTRRPDISALEPETATADFATNAQALPVSPSLRSYEDYVFPATYTENGLTISFTDGETPAFLWNSTTGVRLRMAKDATLTVQAPAGYVMTGITFVANTLNLVPDVGSMSSRNWSGESDRVVFSTTAANTISSVTATMERDANDLHLVAAPQTQTGSFIVPDSVTTIDAYAMCGAAYTVVSLPANLDYLGMDALSLPALSSLESYAEAPPVCLADAFTAVPETCTLHIPQGTLSLYKSAAYWTRFFPRMEEDLETAVNSLVLTPSSSSELYDLQGRRVGVPQRGVYIQNGHKVVR